MQTWLYDILISYFILHKVSTIKSTLWARVGGFS